MTTKITSNQENRICDLYRDAIRKMGLSKDDAQEVISSGNVLQADATVSIKKLLITNKKLDKKFGFAVNKFEFTVPTDYNSDTQIDTFVEKVKGLRTTYFCNNDLTSKNFPKVTNKLEPGKTYKVEIIPILRIVTSNECMKFLEKKNSLLVGGQGLTLVFDLKKEEFRKGKWTVSFDKKENLWKDSGGNHRVPGVSARTDDGFQFNIGRFGIDWRGLGCLLCVSEVLPVAL